MPGQYGFHGELRKRLQQRQDRERDTLRDKELSGFRGPGDQHGREQDSRSGPQNGLRTSLANPGRDSQEKEGPDPDRFQHVYGDRSRRCTSVSKAFTTPWYNDSIIAFPVRQLSKSERS